jgi:hypothetical protein
MSDVRGVGEGGYLSSDVHEPFGQSGLYLLNSFDKCGLVRSAGVDGWVVK